MKKLVLPFILLVMSTGIAQEIPHTVNVNATGEVKVVPDEVTLTINVENEGKEAATVKKENDATVDNILDLTKQLGIKQNDVQTQYVRLYRTQDYKTKVSTYRATQTISIKLRELKRYDEVMLKLIDTGVNGVQGISFSSSKMEEYESQARKKAIANAKMKAEEYAAALGQKVGTAIQISEAGTEAPQPMPQVRMAKAFSDTQESLAPGEMTITANVQVNFALVM